MVESTLATLNQAIDSEGHTFVYLDSGVTSQSATTLVFNVSVLNPNTSTFVEGARLKQFLRQLEHNPVMTDALLQTRALYMVGDNTHFVDPNNPATTFLYGLLAVCSLVIIIVVSKVWAHRTNKAIRNMVPWVTSVMLIGMLLVQLGVLFYVGLPTDKSCFLRKALVDIGFTLFYG
jgi:hypothetical protein